MELAKNVLVKLGRSGSLISVSTISRMCGRQGRFLICADNLRHWMQEHEQFGETFIDTDCGHYLSIKVGVGKYHFHAVWLSQSWESEGGTVTGYVQDFSVSMHDLRSFVYTTEDCEAKFLYQPEWQQSRIIMDARCHMSDNKLVRRAFSKAMRDCFKWGADEQILLYPDGASGYGFTEMYNGKRYITGGLIAHWGNCLAPNGRTYTKVSFSVHT